MIIIKKLQSAVLLVAENMCLQFSSELFVAVVVVSHAFITSEASAFSKWSLHTVFQHTDCRPLRRSDAIHLVAAGVLFCSTWQQALLKCRTGILLTLTHPSLPTC